MRETFTTKTFPTTETATVLAERPRGSLRRRMVTTVITRRQAATADPTGAPMGMVRTDWGFLLVQNAARLSGGSAVPKKTGSLGFVPTESESISESGMHAEADLVEYALLLGFFLVDTAESGPFSGAP